MPRTTPPYEKAEMARRGDEAFERVVQPLIRSDQDGQFVAIDVDSQDFEIGADEIEVTDRLRARKPDAAIWFCRIGYPYTRRYGRGHTLAQT